MKDHIKKYCSLGFKIFPVLIYLDKDRKVHKQPAIKDWQTLASSDPDVCLKTLFTGKFDGIGIATGKLSGITVIDIDVKNGNNGFQSLEMRGISLPVTWSQTTPTGGEHRFFVYNEAINQSVAVLAGVDIRNDGGFVVATPTAFPDGSVYEWLTDQAPWEWALAELPQTFVHLCQTPIKKPLQMPEVIKMGERNDVLYKMACSLRAKGLSEAEILGALAITNATRCQDPLLMEELEALVGSAGTKTAGKTIKKKNPLLVLLSIIEKDQALNGLFSLNEFTGDIEFKKSPPWDPLLIHGKLITDKDEVRMKVYLSQKYAFEPNTKLIGEAIIEMSAISKYHPVRDYVLSTTWDGFPRIDTWLMHSCGVVDNIYTRAVSRKVLVAAIARVFNPGCKFDYMLVLEGIQGLGKSMMIENLAGKWFTEIRITETNKDTVDKMRGKWILEVGEMAGIKKADVDHLKNFISLPFDRARLAYRKNTEDFMRQSIFIGTTNPSGDNSYLRDDTGNRRFWPVECIGRIDNQWIKENRGQLFAEAYKLYRDGEPLYFTDEAVIAISQSEQEFRQEADPWLIVIKEWLLRAPDKFTSAEVLNKAIGMEISRVERLSQSRVGRILKKLGLESKQEGHAKVRYYSRPERAPENPPVETHT